MVCREYLVTSPPAGCAMPGSGQVRQIAMPVSVWSVFSKSVSGDGTLEWMPLINALDYAREHPVPAATRTGPQHAAAFLESIQR